MKKVLVVGLGVSGKAAAVYLQKKGIEVFAYDDKTVQSPEGVRPFTANDLKSMDCVVVSPGVPRTHFLYRQALEYGIEVIGEVELACRSIKKPVIAVTGTNGKTTVTLHIAHILRECQKKVCLLGNGGIPITSEDSNDADIVVLELSSFQLETMSSPILDRAAILNITPDHLDRYKSMQDYVEAKLQILKCLKPGGSCYIEQKAYESYRDLISYPVKTYGGATHEEENVNIVKTLCQDMGIPVEKIKQASQSFKKPPHRIEFVRKINGIGYYNDSKGTNLDAVIRCVESINGPIILIAGGVDKGGSYVSWIPFFQEKVKAIMTMGRAAEKIERELNGNYLIYRCNNLADAVYKATKGAKPGDNIVLSPGCSSFDMFKDYAHRGDEFKRIVNEIPVVDR